MALPATALITAKARQASGEQEAVDARPRHLGLQEHRWQGGLIRWRLKQAIQSVFALLDHGSGAAWIRASVIDNQNQRTYAEMSSKIWSIWLTSQDGSHLNKSNHVIGWL
jgi:hypothetical protein